jgi:hypothetical protein
VRGQILELLGDLPRISPPARDGIKPTKQASNELVACCCDFILIGNFVVERLLELSNRLLVLSRHEMDIPQLGNYIR